MKKPLSIIIVLIISATCYAQDVVRYMHSKIIGQDSAIIYFDRYYDIAEPNCADIIRYGHYDTVKRHYIGKFKDIYKHDTLLTVSYGNYSEKGLKDGEFVINFLDGNLLAKGNFKNNEYDGEWQFNDVATHLKEKSNFLNGKYNGKRELYDENGSPLIFMNIHDNQFEITDAWDDGVKIVDHGNGNYVIKDGLVWYGKLLNGVFDGKWSFRASEDVYGYEIFKHGKFIVGYNHTALDEKEYTKISRIHFLPHPPKLGMLNSENLFHLHSVSCDGVNYRKFSYYEFYIFDGTKQRYGMIQN